MNAQICHQTGERCATPLDLEQAQTPWRRLRGLLGRRELKAGHGLWIRPCNAVHCCFMRFAIDVLYLDGSGRILHIRPDLKPWRFSIYWRAASVLELAAGECQRLNIKPGDRLQCDT